ncbi:hypothetical protein [Oceanithermus desulfurans]|uniref:Lipoprotein n=2 Tax=Oceanithermus desulfurans TaxID=227924 RepID=A0A511RLI1_9DEIN|nr:hypothetical protein [Oceanithermus desulfurans]MBB6029002.1 hypothetical protein [Oceanithermus desulfurans]GEM90521.1 hypothetical protein ODE01S_19550 [Oceanithermus desulfurans NBRC 100063]
MRLSKTLGKGLALAALATLLAGLLTACPQVVVGWIDLTANAINSDRCDDGIKAVIEVEEGSLIAHPIDPGETEEIYGAGAYWVWVKPGHVYTIRFQTTRAFDANAANETLTVKAYCMRKNTEPGLSERTFDADLFLTEAGVVDTKITVWDTGTDSDYTVTSPGLMIDYPHP